MNNSVRRLCIAVCILISMLLPGVAAEAAAAVSSADYAASSRLASGRWVRVKTTGTGMHIVTRAQLKAQGLDPAKTHVYGFGGRMVPENFPEGLPDDLPLLPSVSTPAGIIFYGTDHITWSMTVGHNLHSMHPYCEESYYFLSDADPGEVPDLTPVTGGSTDRPMQISTFRARLLHEQDLYAAGNSSRVLLGEDLRTSAGRSFPFTLTDKAGEDVSFNVSVGVHNSAANSLLLTANGEEFPSSKVNVTSSGSFMALITERKDIKCSSERVNIGISFAAPSAMSLGRLDYIEVEYDRALRLREGQLHFYGMMDPLSVYIVEGATDETQLWDVTNPGSPQPLAFDRSGALLKFSPTGYGYREYVAFNPSQVKMGVVPAGKVSNQNIHALPTPDMVIISPQEYMAASERIADMHRRVDGMVVHVLTPESIYNEFSSGSADVGAFRKMLKMWQVRAAEAGADTPQAKYCLIMSRPTYDNKMKTPTVRSAGYPRVPIWQCKEDFSHNFSYSCDDLIGMLDHGSGIDAKTKIHVAVGRLPVRSVAEANLMADKIINYVENPEYGSWRNRVLLIADDKEHQHIDQSMKAHRNMLNTKEGQGHVYDLLYFDAFDLVPTAAGDTYPEVTNRLLRTWDEGVGFISYIGHANPSGWSHEKVLTWDHINSFSNSRLPILYAATCEFLRWDDDELSGSEIMLLNPNGGIVGGILPSRTVMIDANGLLTEALSMRLFQRASDGSGKRLGDVLVESKNDVNNNNNLRFCIMADPALRLFSPSLQVGTMTVGDSDANDEAPILGARSSVRLTGTIDNPDGTVAEDFNGILELTLFDAETTVTTNGNNGTKIYDFNTRDTRLATESTVVRDGRWETTLRLPADITNNFSPAQINYYAYSDKGVEANGSYDNLYVYGYDESADIDLLGPDIELFTLDHENFAMGDVTHRSPLVMARFSDESGINISNASFGHEMSLLLDGKTALADVASRYTPDPMRDGAGSLVYPLQDLEPGDHSLELKVWDNAGNSSTATILFTVAVRKAADIAEISLLPRTDDTLISMSLDRPTAGVTADVEICTLDGRPVWNTTVTGSGKTSSVLSVAWPHTDNAGRRVVRGIYVCRTTVTTADSAVTRTARKVAVGAK